jgi:hypothetical protein
MVLRRWCCADGAAPMALQGETSPPRQPHRSCDEEARPPYQLAGRLALLSDERYAGLYTRAQRQAIERHVPWTRKVRHGPTTRHGRPIRDLAAYICQRSRELVLKPNDEYGGKGVVLGWTVDAREWEQAVDVALTQSYVVQEAVPVPREAFPVALEGLRLLDLAVDMDPYLFDGRVAGTLTRLSSSALLNVTAGAGSIVPAYVVEGSL